MSDIYLAGRYLRRHELVGYQRDLEAAGHVVTSRWLLGEHQWDGAAVEIARAYEAGENPPEAVGFAEDDVADIQRSEMVVSFTEVPRSESSGASRGGRHVEFGLALGWEKRLIVVGPRENVFHLLSEVEQFDDWPSALAALTPIPASVR